MRWGAEAKEDCEGDPVYPCSQCSAFLDVTGSLANTHAFSGSGGASFPGTSILKVVLMKIGSIAPVSVELQNVHLFLSTFDPSAGTGQECSVLQPGSLDGAWVHRSSETEQSMFETRPYTSLALVVIFCPALLSWAPDYPCCGRSLGHSLFE